MTSYIYYRIYNNDLLREQCYIGKTINLTRRMYEHKTYYTNNKGKKRKYLRCYDFIRENGGFTNWKHEILETLICDTFKISAERELFWINFYSATLNYTIPLRTTKEWRQSCPEYLKEYGKKANALRLLPIQCECGLMTSACNKYNHIKSQIHQKLMENKTRE